jgi:LacI family transcriptional regulator
MPRKPTINDIARLAGVSKTTVSRVLNHKPDVDTDTRERIMRIMQVEGFVPSLTASSMAARTRLIGVLLPSFTWPFLSEIMRGVAEVIQDTPYELLLYSVSNATREHERSSIVDRGLANLLTAGLLAVLPGQLWHHLVSVQRQDFPVVMIDDQDVPSELSWVSSDNQHGAFTAVSHLIHLGHRRIAHISGPMSYFCSRERYLGYCKALQEGGLEATPELVVEGDFLEMGGFEAASKLFALPEDRRPTAIFAANDLTAYGVLTAAEKQGIQIPRDLALIGFDDIVASAHVRPALTTVKQSFYEMGQQGMKLLLSQLDTTASKVFLEHRRYAYRSYALPEEGSSTQPVRIQLATQLIVRASCGASSLRTTLV